MKSIALTTTLAAAALAVASPGVAATIDLDMTSGAFSNVNGTTAGAGDTYTEDGFQIQMDRAGDHLDANSLGSDIYIHNGFSNADDVSWTLTFGGTAFNLLAIEIGLFNDGLSSFTATGSSGATQVISSTGNTVLASLMNVVSVTFDLDQDGGTQGLGLDGMTVSTDIAAVPLPAAMPLLGGGMIMLLGFGARRRRKSA